MDEEKVANAKAKNFLEAHIFETKDAMYSEVVESVSTEEQREVIVAALTEAGDWMEDDGYIAETKVGGVTYIALPRKRGSVHRTTPRLSFPFRFTRIN